MEIDRFGIIASRLKFGLAGSIRSVGPDFFGALEIWVVAGLHLAIYILAAILRWIPEEGARCTYRLNM
jgi:hypothetical protein